MSPQPNQKTPRFDQSKVTVIYVLGGPGAGKGTQCTLLAREFDFCHLSAGDLLRAEQNQQGSQYKELIDTCIKQGGIVPMKITVGLLKNAMAAVMNENRSGDGWTDGKGRFLIDGFPREKDQALEFEQEVCLPSLVLFYNTTEEVMENRLRERSKTSRRADDNEATIKKRFQTYNDTTMPVIDKYDKEGKVAKIDSSGSVEQVHNEGSKIIRGLFPDSYEEGSVGDKLGS